MRLKSCTPVAKAALRIGPALGILLGAAAFFPAAAQPSTGANYNTQTMNFDLWCQGEAELPAERCDKRLPKDVKTFEAYRAKVEKYEIPYLQRKNQEDHINRTLLNNDPIDNPNHP